MAMIAKKNTGAKDAMYIVAYLLAWLSGIVVYFIAADNKRLRMNAIEAIAIGIITMIVFWLPIGVISDYAGLLVYLFGLYMGYIAYDDEDDDFALPWLTDYAARTVGYTLK